MRSNKWKTRGKRAALATVAALVSIWGLYVIIINVFLSTSLFDKVVNFDKVMLDVHYESGWSIWPTRVHAKHVSIRSSDSNLAWLLKLDEVTFEMSLLDLPRRRFTVNYADGHGVSMRIQTKRMSFPDTQDEIKHLPPIDGFPAFAVSPANPHHPELWEDEQYKLITVTLENIHAHDVREIWIDDYRFSGHADLDGGFYLKPLREVEIGPVHAELHSGELQQGPNFTLVHSLGGTADITGARFDPRDVQKNEAMRYFDIATKLHGRSIELARMPFAPPVDVYFDGVVDFQNIGIKIEKGRLANGASLDLRVDNPRIAHRNHIGDGEVTVHAEVTNGQLRANAELPRWRVVRADAEELLHVARLYAVMDSADLDLAKETPLEDLHLAAGVDAATVPDGRITNCILPCSVRVKSGTATVSAHGEAWPRQALASASARLTYRDVRAVVPELDGTGSGDVRATIASYRWDTGVMEGLELHGELRDGAVTAQPVPLRRVRTGEGTIDFRAEQLELADPLHASWDARLTLSGLAADEGITVAYANLGMRHRQDIMVVDARIDGGRVVNGAKLSFLPFPLASEKGQFRGDARMFTQNDVVRGRVNVRSERIGIQTEKVTVVGNGDIAVDIRKFIPEKVLDLGPSRVEVRNVRGYIAGTQAFRADRVRVDGVARSLDLVVPSMKAVDAHVAIVNVVAPDVKAFQPLLSSSGTWKLTGGAVTASGELAVAGEDGASGDIVIDAKRAGFTHGESTLVGDLRLAAKVAGVSDNTVNVSGSRLSVRNLDVHGSSFEAANWHGDVALDDAVFDWTSGEPGFGADIELEARDARPLLGMLETPKIAGAFVTMPDVKVRAHLDAEPDRVLLRDVHAHGGDVAFRGSYALVDGDKRGAFVVSKGPLSMGLRLGNDGAHPHFFGLDSWLREEEKKVKVAPVAAPKP